MSTSNAKCGELTLADGSDFTLRGGKAGELVVQELHGRYYETTYRKHGFFVATQALVTTTVGLATTYTGLVLSNPLSSGFNLVLNKVTTLMSLIQATQTELFGLAVGFSSTANVTHTTPVTPNSSLIGSGLSAVAKADVSATLPAAPVYHSFIDSTSTATADATFGEIDYEGSIILPPGAFAALVTPTQASVAGVWASMQWEEVPV